MAFGELIYPIYAYIVRGRTHIFGCCTRSKISNVFFWALAGLANYSLLRFKM